ncbi:RING finger protein [Endozoicomonas acroporae]|uniref:RING finger protein n=1 Tax=Endozoicomonas acroporae TaxID=1701104 RepID=UPI003D7BF057
MKTIDSTIATAPKICSICHESSMGKPGPREMVTTACHHRFHFQCITNWLDVQPLHGRRLSTSS